MLKFYRKQKNTYKIKGVEYPLDLSFATVIKMLKLINNKDLSIVERLDGALFYLFGEDCQRMILELPYDDKLEIYHTIYNESIGMPARPDNDVERDRNGDPLYPDEIGINKYSLDYDSDAIYSSFMQAYGIDLVDEQSRMSWQKFNALLAGLPENVKFSQIMSIRDKDLGDIKDPLEKGHWERLKARYRLPEEYRKGI